MIKALHVENFRCFPRLDLSNLGRINVVVGKNGAGKTALLESFFLPGGTPQLVTQLDTLRGLGYPLNAMPLTRVVYESIWRRLFFRFSQNQPIVISLKGTAENTRQLRVFYSPPKEIQLFADEKSKDGIATSIDSSTIIPISFETTDHENKKYLNQPIVNPSGQIMLSGAIPPNALVAFFSSTFATDPSMSATQFSQLRIRKQEGPVLETLRAVFPEIANISSEIAPTGVPMLYCETPGIAEKVPVGLVSNGIYRLLAILLGIASAPKGAVLIDEIENGFYYEALPKVWESVFRVCRQYDVQLFASTHSLECLRAISTVLRQNEAEFRLLRAEGSQDSSHTVRVFSGDEFAAALDTGTEFR